MKTITINDWTPNAEWQAAYHDEERTHRHLAAGELVQAGDIYGGTDWGFVFTIGSPEVTRPKPGQACDNLLGYRIRRKR